MRAGMVIEGRFPSLNDYVDAERANRHVGAKMKRRETARAEAAAIAQGLPRFAGPVAVRFLWVEPNRRRDLDNVAFAKKFVLDGLVAAGGARERRAAARGGPAGLLRGRPRQPARDGGGGRR